mmetsp:Transcript_135241/g.337390  ORF Transcript_135241/g.337390 Transcript_135241/m.337390 type:complete len:932 (+) Transcript_135241:98-2893(+)
MRGLAGQRFAGPQCPRHPDAAGVGRLFALGLAGLAVRGQAFCPTDLEPYASEPSPFGWPVTPSDWQFEYPDCWPAQYEQCGGERQSPMDLDFRLPQAECAPQSKGEAGALAQRAHYKILAGHPAVSFSKYMRSAVVAGALGTLMLKDTVGNDIEYEATQAHLTAGSWHSINGSLADAELLIVHKPKGARDALAASVVLSVLFRRSQTGASAFFQQLGFGVSEHSHEIGATYTAPESVDLASVVAPALQGSSFAYSGSVPVPPCTENVRYIVLAAEQLVGVSQLEELKELLIKHTGGSIKRPPQSRVTAAAGTCRRIDADGLDVPAMENTCAKAQGLSAACWAKTCDLSPIDVDTSRVDKSQVAGSIDDVMRYKVADHVTVTPSTYTLDITGNFGGLLVNGRLFEAKSLHLRAISQHTFNGTRYAGELVVEHLLFGDSLGAGTSAGHTDHHRRLETEGMETEEAAQGHHGESDGLHRILLSVPLTLGRESALLRELGLGLEANKASIRDGNSYDVHGAIDLAASLRPGTAASEGSWYWYSGGLTTPGACPSWGVRWLLLERPLEVSLEQLNALALQVSGMDSTVTPRPLPSTRVAKGFVPEDALEDGGGCEGKEAGRYSSPSCWKATNPVCGSGQAQSPIDIDSSAVTVAAAGAAEASFLSKTSWKPISGLRVVNNGEYLGFENNQLGYATVTGPNGFPKFYQVTSVALRMPSEHLIDGKQFPAELQVTHKNQKTVLEFEDDDAIITSFLFELGEESKLLRQFLSTPVPAVGSYTTIEKPVDLMWALGPALDGSFFKYDGSYTTPSCAEAVQWVVFDTPMTLSLEQWQAFKSAFPNPSNNRPVQPLNGRTIARNSMQEAGAVDYKFFLNREMGRDKRTTPVGYIAFPIIGTVVLCSVVMRAVFQREDPRLKAESAGGITAEATTIGKGYSRL